MNDKFERFIQIIESAKQVRLHVAEKQAIEQRLLEIIKEKQTSGEPILGAWGIILFSRWAIVSAASGLTVVMAMAVTQGALPGTWLYPAKIALWESAPSLLAVTDVGRARWHIVRASNRLDEAESLAASGDLDSERAAMLASQAMAHMTNFDAWARDASSRQEALREVGQLTVMRIQALADPTTMVAHAKEMDHLTEADLERIAASGALASAKRRLENFASRPERAKPEFQRYVMAAEQSFREGEAYFRAKEYAKACVLFLETQSLMRQLEKAFAAGGQDV